MNPSNNANLQAEAAIHRFGLKLAGTLNAGTDTLPHDVAERLRFARQQAVIRAGQVRRVAAAASVSAQGNGTAALSGPPALWLRLASVVPLLMLAVGLVLINHQQDLEQIAAAAEVDSALLADELPPSAYSDPGFNAFLKAGPTP